MELPSLSSVSLHIISIPFIFPCDRRSFGFGRIRFAASYQPDLVFPLSYISLSPPCLLPRDEKSEGFAEDPFLGRDKKSVLFLCW